MIGFDLVIRSELPVPGAIETVAGESADIGIVLGRAGAERGGERFRLLGDEVIFDQPGVATYACGPDRIVVEPTEGAAEALVSAWLIASALPALLWMRGDIVLHASCAIPANGGAAVAICGPSMTGKSTALARMVEEGGTAIGEDSIRIDLSGAHAHASGLPALLWRKAEASSASRSAFGISPDRQRRRARLGAIFIAAPGIDGQAPHFSRLSGTAALATLLAQRHRAAVPSLLRNESMLLGAMGRLLALPIYLWHRPRGVPVLEEAELDFLSAASKGGA